MSIIINTTKNDFNKDLVKAVIQLGLTADQLGELANHYLSIAVSGDCCAELSGAMSKCVVELSLLKGDTVRSTVFSLMNDDDAKPPYAELQCVVGAVNYLLANFRDISSVKRLVVGDKDLSKLYRVARTALGLRQCDLAKLISNTTDTRYEESTLVSFIGRIENSTRSSHIPVKVVKMLVDVLNNFLSDVKLVDLKPASDKKEESVSKPNIGSLIIARDNLAKANLSTDSIIKLIMFYYHFAKEDRLYSDMRSFVNDKTASIAADEVSITHTLDLIERGLLPNANMLELINGVTHHWIMNCHVIQPLNNSLFPRVDHTDPTFFEMVHAVSTVLCLRKIDLIHLIQHHVNVSVSASTINAALTDLKNGKPWKITDSFKSMLASGVNSMLEEWGFTTKLSKQKPSKASLTQLSPNMANLDKHLQNALTALDLSAARLAAIVKEERLKLTDHDALNRYIGNLLLGLSTTSPSMSIVVDAVCSVVNKLLVNAEYVKLDIPTNQNRLERVIQRSSPAMRERPVAGDSVVQQSECDATTDDKSVFIIGGYSMPDAYGDVKINPLTYKSDGEIENITPNDPIMTMLTNIVKCNAALSEQNQQLAKEVKELRSDIQRLTESVNERNRAQPWSGFNQYHKPIRHNAVEWNPNPHASGSFGFHVVNTPDELLALANQPAGLIIHVNQNYMNALQHILINAPQHLVGRCTVFVRT